MSQTCFTISKGISTIITIAKDNHDTSFDGGAVTYYGGYCARYAVIYQNAFGGWDSFLIEGTVYKNGKNTQHTYAKTYDTTTNEREKVNYANEIEYSYNCTTGWLTDEESERLAKHLLSSPNIYLQDLVEGTLIPVIISTNSYKFKTYQNEGKKMVNYNFILTESNIKVRQI